VLRKSSVVLAGRVTVMAGWRKRHDFDAVLVEVVRLNDKTVLCFAGNSRYARLTLICIGWLIPM